MNILLLCNKSPWPPSEGGPIAMNAMAEGLINADHSIKILAINSNKYSVDPDSIPSDYRIRTRIEAVYIDLSVKPLPALLNLFSGKSYHVERFISKDFETALVRILKTEKFDIVQFETLFTTPYAKIIRQLTNARLVLRAHNIEHLIWERIALGCKNPLKKIYLSHLARTLKSYEIETCRQMDGIVAITAKDADFFRRLAGKIPVTDVPFGINFQLNHTAADQSEEPPHEAGLFHLGSMNWIPNQEGIKWFISKVWPKVHTLYPELKFHLAGREMPEWLKNSNQPGIKIDGEVPDAMAYMKSRSIMVVPLLSGSGIRIKIIEGMLAGCAIITTPIGAEGIGFTDGENILIADEAEAFVEKISQLIQNPGLAEKIGKNARLLVKKDHNNQILMQNLTDFYKGLLR